MSQRRDFERKKRKKPVDEIADEILSELNSINKLRELEAESIDKWSERFGKALSRDVKVNQIRKIFSEVKRLQKSFEKERFEKRESKEKKFDADKVNLLKPKLAYTAGRHGAVRPLQKVLSGCITGKISEPEDFQKFVDLFEAILAYHKYYGGRET